MVARTLPSVRSLSEYQLRGLLCVWCKHPLRPGRDRDLGEQTERATKGATYHWYPRSCADWSACAARERALEVLAPACPADPSHAVTYDDDQEAYCDTCQIGFLHNPDPDDPTNPRPDTERVAQHTNTEHSRR
ncbi:hypothetical protein [Streptomyces sp. NPDC059783]|uniref:hypothetical protein n=1 Tax=Streptomyces sp. NPDC059783 TaxID=3346944 RepID=UPI003666D303